MLYLLLKETYTLLPKVDASYGVWQYADKYEASSLEEAVSFIPDINECKYLLYEVKSEAIEVTIRKPDKLEKVWKDPRSAKEIVKPYVEKLKATVAIREGDEDLPLSRCEHSVVSPNRRKYCSTCRDNAAAHF